MTADEKGNSLTYWGGLEEPKQSTKDRILSETPESIKQKVRETANELVFKQETLEEASWKFNPLKKLDGEFLRHAFKKGAEWQKQNSYSEEDMLKSFMAGIKCESNSGKNFEQFIEQFKKK